MTTHTAAILRTDVDRDGTQLNRRLARNIRVALAKEHNVSLSVHGDFGAFAQVDRQGWHTFQAYTNQYTHAARGIAILVKDGKETIATYACALYDAHPDMATVVDTKGFYNDGTGDRFRIVDPSCRQWFEAMRGRVACSGGIWVKPSRRKSPLSRTLVPLLPLFGRTIAVECWAAEHVFALMPADVVSKQIGARYRLSWMEPGLEWLHGAERIPFWFGYHPPVVVTRDAIAFLERGTALFELERTGVDAVAA